MPHSTDIGQQLVAEGWVPITDDGFVGLIGPFFQKNISRELEFQFPTDTRHKNTRGVVQGGALAAFADRALGIAARAATGATRTATIQFDIHFVKAAEIGDLVKLTPMLVHNSNRLIFMNGAMTVDDRTVATVMGVWKKLDPSRGPLSQ